MPGSTVKREIVDGARLAVVLRQAVRLDHGVPPWLDSQLRDDSRRF